MSFDIELRELTDRIAAPLQSGRAETESAFIFRVHNEWFAMPTRACERTVDKCIVHSVPHRRGGVLLGIGSVEGDLLPVISLAVLLAVRGTGVADGTGRVLLMSWKQRRFAAPVDEIHGVHRYHPDDLLPLPATLSGDAAFTVGLLSWHNRNVGVLDPGRVLEGVLRGVA